MRRSLRAHAGPRGDRQVCNCHKVTEARLREAIDGGASTVEALCASTKAGSGCGSCKSDLAQILASHAPPAAKVAVAN